MGRTDDGRLFMMPAVAIFDERRTDRPVGRSVERYQRMHDEIAQGLARAGIHHPGILPPAAAARAQEQAHG